MLCRHPLNLDISGAISLLSRSKPLSVFTGQDHGSWVHEEEFYQGALAEGMWVALEAPRGAPCPPGTHRALTDVVCVCRLSGWGSPLPRSP